MHPTSSFPAVEPGTRGLRSRYLLRLLDTLEGCRIPGEPEKCRAQRGSYGSLDPHSLLILQGGDLLFEAEWAPYSAFQPAVVYSVSKTYTSLAIGFCESEGLLTVDDDPGRILGVPNPGDIRIKHLLTMNSGHERGFVDSHDIATLRALSTMPEHTPGTHFAYDSSATYVLSKVVTAVTGQSITQYLRPRLFEPLGIGTRWMIPLQGVEQGFSGLHLTTWDMAKTGVMLAQSGRVGGRQIVPADYLERMVLPISDNAPSAPVVSKGDGLPDVALLDWAQGYGYQIWRSRQGFRADGAYGQFILVIPEKDIVIAYQGATNDLNRALTAFWELLDAWESAETVGAESHEDVERLRERVHRLDAWDNALHLEATGEDVPGASSWTVTRTDDGWRVEIPLNDESASALVVPAGEGFWACATTQGRDVDGQNRWLKTAARGKEQSDGGTLIHLLFLTSPHRAVIHVAQDGSVQAQWHPKPLWGEKILDRSVPGMVV